ncbi:MAG TPA: DoxX family protein [Stellaceae bacterium]|nr:DoxX family protein [Stellaceae bacterium]
MSEARGLSTAWKPRVLSIFRIMVGLLYTQHGLNKLFDFPPTAGHHSYVLFSLNPGLAALLEVVGGPLVVLGLFTRWVAFILSGEMAVAYFMVFAPRRFYPLTTGGDLAVLYCFSFFYLFVAGGGAWSLDRLRARA